MLITSKTSNSLEYLFTYLTVHVLARVFDMKYNYGLHLTA